MMKIAHLLVIFFPFWAVILISVSTKEVVGESYFSAMFVFGDSLVDCGNNNYLNSLAKSNFPPYGIDFSEGPTGRFTNGKTMADILGEIIGLPLLPSFAEAMIKGKSVYWGVNYASAGAGILNETGNILGARISFSQQVQDFKVTKNQLKIQMEPKKLSQHLANSLAVVILGSNDYINNYLVPIYYSSSLKYNPKDYAKLLIENYKSQILTLHGMGLRKFLLAGIPPLGCIPIQLGLGFLPEGECRNHVNDMVDMFNVLLRSLVDQLNAEYHGSLFACGNTDVIFYDLIKNAKSYGFTVTDKACCGFGINKRIAFCLPALFPCEDRNKYIFWDAFHTSEAANRVFAQRTFTGPPSSSYPFNVKQMAQMGVSPSPRNKTSVPIVSKT